MEEVAACAASIEAGVPRSSFLSGTSVGLDQTVAAGIRV
jgi:hypothetical protein